MGHFRIFYNYYMFKENFSPIEPSGVFKTYYTKL